MLYKLKNKALDLKFNYKTTVVLLPEKSAKFISNLLIGLGLISVLFLPINSVVFKNLNFLGTLPFRFFWLILGIIILTPFYWTKFKNTKGVFIIQTLVYLSYLIVAIFFMVLYAFWCLFNIIIDKILNIINIEFSVIINLEKKII